MTDKKSVAAVAAVLALVVAGPALAGGNAAAGKIKSKVCAQCHGADGNSTVPTFPRLAGQQPDYIVKALHDYKTGARKNPIMAGFAAKLTEQDREDLAAWFSSQKGLITPSIPR